MKVFGIAALYVFLAKLQGSNVGIDSTVKILWKST